jgi:propanol-preferring alcohol dehydrogenase
MMEGAYSSPTNYSAVLTRPYGQPYEFFSTRYPIPGPAEVIVRLDFTGVCHGDVYSRDGGGPAPVNPIRPLVGGHEGVGEIVSLGEGTESLGVAVGDIVGIALEEPGLREVLPLSTRSAEPLCGAGGSWNA